MNGSAPGGMLLFSAYLGMTQVGLEENHRVCGE
jgi:hypothetical protein